MEKERKKLQKLLLFRKMCVYLHAKKPEWVMRN